MLIRAVATDVDGTITDEGSFVSLEAIESIRELERSGMAVMLCSGNALCVLKTLARYLGCTGPTIAENGAVVEYKGNIRVIGEKGKAKEVVEELKSTYGEKVRETWSNTYRLVDVAILRTLPLNAIKEVANKFSGIKVVDSGFAFHIIDEKVDKGVGTQMAAEWAGIDLSEIAGIGDSITDLELLKACGYKCAVSNGHAEIKKIADFVSEKKYGEGFTEIAKRILTLNQVVVSNEPG